MEHYTAQYIQSHPFRPFSPTALSHGASLEAFPPIILRMTHPGRPQEHISPPNRGAKDQIGISGREVVLVGRVNRARVSLTMHPHC